MVSINVKKNLLFVFYLLFNTSLAAILLLVDNGFLYISFFILAGHIRDFINVVIQVFCMFKLVKKLPDIPHTTKNTICCLIPIYNEEKELVEKNIASLTSQKLSMGTDVFLMMIFDGLTDKNRGLFGHVENLITFEKNKPYKKLYENWKTKEETSILYKIGEYNGFPFVLAYKTKNAGKKDSLIIGERFCMDISKIEDISMDKIDFVYHTDGDSLSDENCLNELLKSLVNDENLDGVSGMLRAYGKESNGLKEKSFVSMQNFQYQFSLIVRRQTESLMNSTTCLPGCCNMIRMGDKTDFALEKYTHVQAKESNFLQTIVRQQGTDRRYSTLLLKQGANLQMNWRAGVYTEPPLDCTSFINQRRRWASNSFFNSIVLLYSKNIPLYIKASTLIDICKIFSTIFRFFSYFCFWIFLDKFSTLNIIFACLFLAVPYIYALIWMVCITAEWPSLFIGFFMNKIMMPFLSIASVSKMYFTSTDFAWGSLKKEKPIPKAVKVTKSDKASSIIPISSSRDLDFSEFEDTSVDEFEYDNSNMVGNGSRDEFTEFSDDSSDEYLHKNRMVERGNDKSVRGFSEYLHKTRMVDKGNAELADFADTSSEESGRFYYHNRGGMIESFEEPVTKFGKKKFQIIHPGLEDVGIECHENGIFIYNRKNTDRIRPVLSSLSLSDSDTEEEKLGEENC